MSIHSGPIDRERFFLVDIRQFELAWSMQRSLSFKNKPTPKQRSKGFLSSSGYQNGKLYRWMKFLTACEHNILVFDIVMFLFICSTLPGKHLPFSFMWLCDLHISCKENISIEICMLIAELDVVLGLMVALIARIRMFMKDHLWCAY